VTLAEHLIASLDELNEDQTEQLWPEEEDRSYRDTRKGLFQPVVPPRFFEMRAQQ
jgi:hypothetical protein